MKYIILTAAAVALTLFVIRSGDSVRRTNGSGNQAPRIDNQWVPDFETALAQAKKSGKPVLIDFHATWCPPCKAMEKKTFPDSTVVAELENWVPVKVDVDRDQAIAQRFHIRAMPTLVLLNSDGKEMARTEGYVGPSDFVAFATAARTDNSNQ